jgi:DNA-binding NtrC family response regulator
MHGILVVDDDAAVRKTVAAILTRAGHRVFTADSPSEAFAVVSREQLRVIVSDIHMPGLSGPALMSFLGKRGIALPVLFISGDDALDTVETSLGVPNAAFLAKPFTPAELIAAIDERLRAS